MTTTHNFQVNLASLIGVLGSHLYGDERVFVRELLQNATDAITARQLALKDSPEATAYKGRIDINTIGMAADTTIEVIDNGIGLTESEVRDFLSTVASSTKRDKNEAASNDFIGQFGIGLLSCFMVCDEIVLLTRSIHDAKGIEWRGKSDGTYTIRRLTQDMEIGTKVYIKLKPEYMRKYTKDDRWLIKTVYHYGNLLPRDIVVDGERSWNRYKNYFQAQPEGEQKADFYTHKNAIEDVTILAKYRFDKNGDDPYLAIFPLYSPIGDTYGYAFIPKEASSPTSRSNSCVFLKGMLLNAKETEILPEWAFFAQCVINTNALRPTVSRETIYKDSNFYDLRESLGQNIIAYFKKIAVEEPNLLQKILYVHHNTLKPLALHDDEFLGIIHPYLLFPTTQGNMTLHEIERKTDTIRYCESLETFRQIVAFAKTAEKLIVNAAYAHDAALLHKISRMRPNLPLQLVNAAYFIEQFVALSRMEALDYEWVEEVANEELAALKCAAHIRKFEPTETPTMFYLNRENEIRRMAQFDTPHGQAQDFWQSLLGAFSNDASPENKNQITGIICLNANNTLVQALRNVRDKAQLRLMIRVLYMNAMLLGNYPLQASETALLSSSLLELLQYTKERADADEGYAF
jgi:molecular chaperone HtpG